MNNTCEITGRFRKVPIKGIRLEKEMTTGKKSLKYHMNFIKEIHTQTN
jgi:hypothetical protein